MRLAGLAMLIAGMGMAGPADAAPPSPAAAEVIAAARADCAALGGTMSARRGAVVRLDLDGDGRPDELVDSSRFACTGAASAFCGSGGCALTAIVAGRATPFLARGWKRVTWAGRPILLLDVHGTSCDTIGAARCVRAVVFEADGTPRSPG